MNRHAKIDRLGQAKNVGLWALQIFTAGAFVMAGYAKLAGDPMMEATFEKIGMGQWFRYVTSGIEIIAAVLLVIPRLAPAGAFLLLSTMIGAVLAHVVLLGGSPMPALVLGGFAGIILLGRWDTVKEWLAKGFGASERLSSV